MASTTKTTSPKPVAKRMTRQRKIIKEILCKSHEHPTAEAIYEEARKELPDIGLGTVYRNLQVLVEDGMAIQLNCDKRYSRYDGNITPHAHLFCEQCHQVYDIDLEISDSLLGSAAKKSGADIRSYHLEFKGICKNCRENKIN